MRLAALLTALALAAALALSACGSSESDGDRPAGDATEAAGGERPESAPPGASARSCAGETAGIGELRVTGAGCAAGNAVAAAWSASPDCAVDPGAGRSACGVRGYRCLGTIAERGVAVSCARPQRSISFLAKPD